ncbi:MAG: helix-turn-helix transcriptional regulator [Bacteroidia bacterium]|nr:helix-turn-helix transcriptional regulator [Bacteroidia bacterium]
MPIQSKLEIIMATRRISLNELSGKVNITQANLSNLKRGKARAIRFSTLEALCETLRCQPADLLEYSSENNVWKEKPIDLIGILKNKSS